jgi:hypothetical protein
MLSIEAGLMHLESTRYIGDFQIAGNSCHQFILGGGISLRHLKGGSFGVHSHSFGHQLLFTLGVDRPLL